MSEANEASGQKGWKGAVVTAIGGIVLAILTAWCTHLFGPETKVTDPPPSVDVVSTNRVDPERLLKTSRVSFSDWQNMVRLSFQADRDNALEDYRGARVTWRGVVDQVNQVKKEYGGSEHNRFIVVMYEDEETRKSTALGRAPALCLFAQGNRESVGELQAGQEIIVSGTLAGSETQHGTLLGTRLYDCEILRR